jgi:hypothetical protein
VAAVCSCQNSLPMCHIPYKNFDARCKIGKNSLSRRYALRVEQAIGYYFNSVFAVGPAGPPWLGLKGRSNICCPGSLLQLSVAQTRGMIDKVSPSSCSLVRCQSVICKLVSMLKVHSSALILLFLPGITRCFPILPTVL